MTAQALAHSYRFRGGAARVSAWHGHQDVAVLTLRGDVDQAALERLLGRLRAAGVRDVLTNALTPGASLPLVDAGFTVRERLHLLQHDLSDPCASSRRTRRAQRADRAAILATDRAAFDDFWQFDDVALRDATRATPRSHLRVAAPNGRICAYGLFGLAATTGYVQRLAVAPADQSNGIGRALLGDGLRWMQHQGATRALVNTQHDNTRALSFYTGAGFLRLPVGLVVLGRAL